MGRRKRQKAYASTDQAVQQTSNDSLRPVRNGYRLALGRVVFIRPDQPAAQVSVGRLRAQRVELLKTRR